jgi:hypothetical protein
MKLVTTIQPIPASVLSRPDVSAIAKRGLQVSGRGARFDLMPHPGAERHAARVTKNSD